MIITQKQLLKSILYFNILYSLLSSYVSLNRALIMVPDVILLYFVIKSNKKIRIKRSFRSYYGIIGSFFLVGITSFVLNPGSGLMLVWGCRYYIRFYFYWILCALYFNLNDLEKMFSFLFEKLAVFNLLMVLLQYAQGYYGDAVGGMFGTVQGCNAALNVYTFLQLSYAVSKVLYKEKRYGLLACSAVSAFLTSALAELKILYTEIVIIFAFAVLFSSFRNKIKVLLIGIAVLPIGVNFMNTYSANSLQFITNIEYFIWYNYEIGYGSADAINRFSAFAIISKKVFKNNTLLKLIGVGLGNANKISFLNKSSAIYLRYKSLYYEWFTHAMVFIETGWLGLILYEALFVRLIVLNVKKFKESKNLKVYYFFGMSIAALAILNSIYNNGLTTEASGYIFYFSMAAPLIALRTEENQNLWKQ